MKPKSSPCPISNACDCPLDMWEATNPVRTHGGTQLDGCCAIHQNSRPRRPPSDFARDSGDLDRGRRAADMSASVTSLRADEVYVGFEFEGLRDVLRVTDRPPNRRRKHGFSYMVGAQAEAASPHTFIIRIHMALNFSTSHSGEE